MHFIYYRDMTVHECSCFCKDKTYNASKFNSEVFLERLRQDFQKYFEELPNFDVLFVDLIYQR